MPIKYTTYLQTPHDCTSFYANFPSGIVIAYRDRYLFEWDVIRALLVLTLVNPGALLGLFLVMYFFFAIDMASASHNRIDDYFDL